MAQELWSLKEDGYLNVDLTTKNIVYHPALNIILVITRNASIHVLDVNSGFILQTSTLSAKPNANIKCRYLEDQNKILFTDGYGIGMRSDYNGVLLLDTILQRRLKCSDDIVKLELLLSEALMFQQSLKSIDLTCTDLHSEVLTEISDKITRAQNQQRNGIKAQKWNTIYLELKLSTLRSVALRVVSELKRQNRHIPALAVAAAISERLSELAPRNERNIGLTTSATQCDRSAMYSEAKRRETFARWPHMDYKWALPEQMAQAGFYHQPNSSGDDRAMCFTCTVCLVCWERTDEPWSEHERHSPSCPFVKGEYTQNVPLSVTYATVPALDVTTMLSNSNQQHRRSTSSSTSTSPSPPPPGAPCTDVTIISHSNVQDIIAFGHANGMVTVYNVSGKLKRTHCFYVSQHDINTIVSNNNYNKINTSGDSASTTSASLSVSTTAENSQKILSLIKRRDKITTLTSLCVVGDRLARARGGLGTTKSTAMSTQINKNIINNSNTTMYISQQNKTCTAKLRPSIICGVTVTTTPRDDESNGVECAIQSKKALYLIVYDFQYKSAVSSTTTLLDRDKVCSTGEDSDRNVAPTNTTSTAEPPEYLIKKCNDILTTKLFHIDKDGADSEHPTSEPFVVCNDLSPKSYQNLIPTSDDNSIFLPPDVKSDAPPATEDDASSQGNGLRVCNDDDLLNTAYIDYTFTNGGGSDEQLLDEDNANEDDEDDARTPVEEDYEEAMTNTHHKYISDHITELKLKGEQKLLTYSHAIQCIRISPSLWGVEHEHDLEISEIIPIKSTGRHILIVLRSQKDKQLIDGKCILLLYSLNFTSTSPRGGLVKIDESPLLLKELSAMEEPEEIILLPQIFDGHETNHFTPGDGEQQQVCGLAAMVCVDGSVRLLDLTTLNIVSEAKTPGARYVSLTYCNSLERLCVSTESGPLHFYAIMGHDTEFVEEKDDDEYLVGGDHSHMLSSTVNTNKDQSQSSLIINKCVSASPFETHSSKAAPNQSHSSVSSNQQQNVHLNSQYTDDMDNETLLLIASKIGDVAKFSEMLNNRTTLTVKELKLLHNFCEFDSTCATYCAVLPTCWSEMQQCQRKSAQHNMQQNTNDINQQHTNRIWRLQTDSTTWDEHVIELTLPWSACIGHVDLIFSLHQPCPSLPNIQVTLLKQHASGIGHRKLFTSTNPPSVDDSIQFFYDATNEANTTTGVSSSSKHQEEDDNVGDSKPDGGSTIQNPVLTDEYLQTHNVDILAGPVTLSSSLDLSEHNGTVTLTSPKLLKARGRTLLIHIKALLDPSKDMHSNSNNGGRGATAAPTTSASSGKDDKNIGGSSSTKKSRTTIIDTTSMSSSSIPVSFGGTTNIPGLLVSYGPIASSLSDHLAAHAKKANKVIESYIGCDWLHEISFSIRTMKQTTLPNERQQRIALLESNHLITLLCEAICKTSATSKNEESSPSTRLIQSLSLDLLKWIATLRLGYYKSELGLSLLHNIEPHLYSLIMSCIIYGTRTIAHKLTTLLIVCIDNGRTMLSPLISQQFDNGVLQALLRASTSLGRIQSSSALRWYTMLLQHVITVNTISVSSTFSVAMQCLTLVSDVAKQLQTRSNPYHQLLRSRFGLYGMPFEPELLDIEPPVFNKSSSFPVTFASVVAGDMFQQASSSSNNNTHNTNGSMGSSGGGAAIHSVNSTTDQFDIKNLFSISGSLNNTNNTQHMTMLQENNKNANNGTSTGSNGSTIGGISKCRDLITNNYLKGLLETVPLHYVCASASEGTRIEKLIEHSTNSQATMNASSLLNGNGSANVANMYTMAISNAVANGTKFLTSDSSVYIPKYPKYDIDQVLKSPFNNHCDSNDLIDNKFDEQNLSNNIITDFKNHGYLTYMYHKFNKIMSSYDKKLKKKVSVDTSDASESIFNQDGDNDTESSIIFNMNSVNPWTTTSNSTTTTTSLNTTSNTTTKMPTSKPTDATNAQINHGSTIAWQQLLLAPSQHILVIERMHSGARRYVTLDFGAPILLTDLLIPACNDLVSLCVDIWLHSEDHDCVRLIVSGDIGTKNLVLSDIQPAPLCRYMKITIIGRYGMASTRCRIPIGNFYGHMIVLPEDVYYTPSIHPVTCVNRHDIDLHYNYLLQLLEDINCRYTLACSKLRDLLDPYLLIDDDNMYNYLKIKTDKYKNSNNTANNNNGGNTGTTSAASTPGGGSTTHKILITYNECINYQTQLNIVRNIITRLIGSNHTVVSDAGSAEDADTNCLQHTSTDKLIKICENVLEVLLSIVYEMNDLPQVAPQLFKYFNYDVCRELFESLCVPGHNIKIQLSIVSLLIRMCGLQPWWGQFLSDTLNKLYSQQNRDIFPQDRVFILLVYLCRKSLSTPSYHLINRSSILDPILCSLCHLLKPFIQKSTTDGLLLASKTDLDLIGWLLLYLTLSLDSIQFDCESMMSSRWDWLTAESTSTNKMSSMGSAGLGATSSTSSSNYHQIRTSDGYRKKLHKRFLHYKQQLDNLDYTQKAVQVSTQALSAMSTHAVNLSMKLEQALKQQEHFFKKIKQFSTSTQPIQQSNKMINGGDTTVVKRFKQYFDKKGNGGHGGAPRLPSEAGSSASTAGGAATISVYNNNTALNYDHCLNVCRGLILLVLNLDCSCNIDIFLLSCKTIARLIITTKPVIQLKQLITKDQLVQLLRLSIRYYDTNQWITHAIVCLLQDILECDKYLYKNHFKTATTTMRANSNASNTTAASPPRSSNIIDDLIIDNNDDDLLLQQQQQSEIQKQWSAATDDQGGGTPVSTNDILDLDDFMQISLDNDMDNQQPMNTNTTTIPLPSLPESDDSDLDDVLDDILEKKVTKKAANEPNNKFGFSPMSSISTATDARLEIGLNCKPEITLRRLTMFSSYYLPAAVCGSLAVPPQSTDASDANRGVAWPEELFVSYESTSEHDTSVDILTKCFNTLISDFEYNMSVTSLEQVLQLWITMSIFLSEQSSNNTSNCCSMIPGLMVSSQSISQVIRSMTTLPSVSLRAWTLTLQFLTLVSNLPFVPMDMHPSGVNSGINELEQSLNGFATYIIQDTRFFHMLLRFFSGNGMVLSDKRFTGPTVCQTLHELLVRLQIRADVVTGTSRLGNELKNILLKLLNQMIEPGIGSIAIQHGPLDAQCEFIQTLLNLDFMYSDLTIIENIIQNLGILVHNYMSNNDSVKVISIAELKNTQTHSFGNIFSSVLGTNSNKHGKPPTYDQLMISLLKLSNKLIQIPIRNEDGASETIVTEQIHPVNSTAEQSIHTSSQTDECKVQEQQQNGGGGVGSTTTPLNKIVPPCVADTMLKLNNIPTMLRFYHTLNLCTDSTLAMLLVGATSSPTNSDSTTATGNNNTTSTSNNIVVDISEPSTIGDALFLFMSTVSNKCTNLEYLLKSLLEFLTISNRNATIQNSIGIISEPLVLWLLQILSNDLMLKEFIKYNGVQLIANHLVQCYRSTISNLQPATISQIMQYLSPSQQQLQSTSVQYHQGGTVNSKKMQQANIEQSEGLINFAPLGQITSTSPTAQSADVLIQATVAPHRRTRTPQWSYHFYPDENHVELYITLPTAILLREVQLQPHLNSLATCPSAIALEVSHTGTNGLVPICPPLPTSGLSFIRMHLPRPEIVTSVLIRLYKPKDSTNIGLLQIRLLGTTAFTSNNINMGGFNKLPPTDNNNVMLFDDCCHLTTSPSAPSTVETRSSLGWLRLLHQCFNINVDKQLSESIVAQAAQVEHLLETCCGLLLVSSIFGGSTHLEQVLLKLCLHDQQLCLHTIQMLLNNNNSLQQQFQQYSVNNVNNNGAIETVCELLYKLCTIQDASIELRVQALLTWLHKTALINITDTADKLIQSNTSASYIHCIASILWSNNGTLLNLKQMITNDLFELIYKWTLMSTISIQLKKSLDTLLCSFCVINDTFFQLLLFKMCVLVPNMSTDRNASVTDDQKNLLTDELEYSSNLTLCDIKQLHLTESQLNTVAIASASPIAIKQLLDSGLPKLLTDIIYQFCIVCSDILKNVGNKLEDIIEETFQLYPMIRLEHVINILNFFADMCSIETCIRDWLGDGGANFWIPLLRLLCFDRTVSLSLQQNNYYKLEDATIRFLTKACSICPKNQQLLAICLCDVIEYQKQTSTEEKSTSASSSGISGFTRRLILQLLLENEKVWVSIKADEIIYKNATNQLLTFDFGPHPAYRVTNNHILLYLDANTTLDDIFDTYITFTNNYFGQTSTSTSVGGGGTSTDTTQKAKTFVKDMKKDLWEVALDMSDQMSVAAGVTAKDKRIKDAKNLLWQTTDVVSGSDSAWVDDLWSNGQPTGFNSKPIIQKQSLFKCEQLPAPYGSAPLSNSTKLSQLLYHLNTQVIQLTVVPNNKDNGQHANEIQLDNDCKVESTLHVFSSLGGLAILAQQLPILYSDNTIAHPLNGNTTSTSTNNNNNTVILMDIITGGNGTGASSSIAIHHGANEAGGGGGSGVMSAAVAAAASAGLDNDWVKVDGTTDDILHDDLEDSTAYHQPQTRGQTTPTTQSNILPNVPPHSLAAFALFLRLPGYANMLLRDYRKAQCLLRLVLGVTDDGEGGDIFQLPIAYTLPTLPFQILCELYNSIPIVINKETTDKAIIDSDIKQLRLISIQYGVIHLLLGNLSVFTHQTNDYRLPSTSSSSSSGDNNGDSGGKVTTNTSPTKTTQNSQTTDDKTHLYWAKGTGFGTGSTQQSWNVEMALLRQRIEEEHVTVLLQVLSSYINPSGAGDGVQSSESTSDTDNTDVDEGEPLLPSVFYDLLQQSCLLPVICSYLRNDSVLDMARHIPLYRALLQLLRSIAIRQQLVTLLLPTTNTSKHSNGTTEGCADNSNESKLCVLSLLTNMKLCVDTYASRLKLNVKSTPTTEQQPPQPTRSSVTSPKSKYNITYTTHGTACISNDEDNANNMTMNDESDEGLALLIPDIQITAELVRQAAIKHGCFNKHSNGDETNCSISRQLSSDDANDERQQTMKDDNQMIMTSGVQRPQSLNMAKSLEQRYLEVIKRLQFDTFEMIRECSELEGGGYQFVVSYHFESNVKAAGDRSHPTRVKRLAQEAVTLATSLPLSFSSSVFVRCDTDRLDVMKVLITGPADTPYANGCFELDVYFPPDYPQSPMMINLETTGRHTVRFNPNLYNDGKVCLSVLNTWHGRPEEKWNAQTSSFLQVLVSIQSLILVPEPYFNEPGYERSRGTPAGTQSSLEYNANIYQATVRWAMLEQIRNPSPCFKQIIHTHFWLKRHEIAAQIERWITELETIAPEKRNASGGTRSSSSRRVPAVSALALKHHYIQLYEELSRLKTPEGLEDLEEHIKSTPTSSSIHKETNQPKPNDDTKTSTFMFPVATTTSSTAAPSNTTPSESSSTSATTAVNHQNDIDTDMEMEKMVSKVCE